MWICMYVCFSVCFMPAIKGASWLNRIRSSWQSGRQVMWGTWLPHCTALSSPLLPILLNTLLFSFLQSVPHVLFSLNHKSYEVKWLSLLFLFIMPVLLQKSTLTRTTICYTQGALCGICCANKASHTRAKKKSKTSAAILKPHQLLLSSLLFSLCLRSALIVFKVLTDVCVAVRDPEVDGNGDGGSGKRNSQSSLILNGDITWNPSF